MWEVRVVVGFDPARGRSIQRSVTVHGDAHLAGTARRELEGVSVPKVSARWLVIRSAVSWAVAEGLLRVNPLAGMRAL